jgi:hypothetical protein
MTSTARPVAAGRWRRLSRPGTRIWSGPSVSRATATRPPTTHREALRRYPFDTVLTPWNYILSTDEAYRGDFEALVDEIRRQDAGLMTIKTISRRNWPEGDPLEGQRRATWYEPFEDQEYVSAAVSFVLAREEITGIPIVGDVGLIGTTIEAERHRMPLEEAEAILSQAPNYSSPFISIPF